MALGSSAPEILLSVIESLKNLGLKAGELGPGSIVGSGAFNLLVIIGVSIVAVGDEPKKINALGVYSCTAIFSIFAYAWMYVVLEVNSPSIVSLTEAWLTFFFFFLLVGLAFAFDKLQQNKDKNKMSDEEIKETNRRDELKIKKSTLRHLASVHSEKAILAIARGIHDSTTETISSEEERNIIETFKEVLQKSDLSDCNVNELLSILQPESLLERFAAKKANKIGNNNEFLQIKG